MFFFIYESTFKTNNLLYSVKIRKGMGKERRAGRVKGKLQRMMPLFMRGRGTPLKANLISKFIAQLSWETYNCPTAEITDRP